MTPVIQCVLTVRNKEQEMNVYTHRVTYLKFSETLNMNVEVTFRTTTDMVAQHRAAAKKLAVADTVVIEEIEA